MNARHINLAGSDLIKSFEALRLTAYPDPGTNGAPWTIGWGHTGPDVKPGLTITEDKAVQLFNQDIAKFEDGVNRLAPVATDNQFAALVSFAFNLGLANLEESTLLRLHRDGQYAAAAIQFSKWDHAAGKRMPGLTKRRAAEAALYLKG